MLNKKFTTLDLFLGFLGLSGILVCLFVAFLFFTLLQFDGDKACYLAGGAYIDDWWGRCEDADGNKIKTGIGTLLGNQK